ncbi:MAG: hypothetical protein B1H06_06735 [Candidatus Cloacimonas sp. 4484_143]|nr:MAG: hypothetical protein B1H06_06735 [Candidatus Cloacimonas sp. 4484_143]
MLFEKGNFYHLYNRGCNKDAIFLHETDYNDLIKRIQSSKHLDYLKILSYCLMPNHYHFLVQQTSDIPVTQWIGYIFNGYVQSFNKRNEHSGTLFEGRVRAKLITDNNYLIKTVIYIHLNPVIAGLVTKPEDWKYSNYPDWIGLTNSSLTDYKFINDTLDNKNEYKTMTSEALEDKLLQKEIEKELE